MTVGFDPHAGHRVVEDLVVLEQAETAVVDEHAAVLTAPDTVARDARVGARATGDPSHGRYKQGDIPYLHAGIEMVEDVVLLQQTMAIIVEVHADL